MIVDCHVHVLDEGFWPESWFDHVALEWSRREPDRDPAAIRSKIEPGLIDPDGSRLLGAMDAAGIDAAVILPLDWGPEMDARTPWQRMNEHAFELGATHPGRLIPFVGVDPRRDEAAAFVETALASGRARGLKLYPPTGFYPYDERVLPLYESCVRHGAPVLIHTGETLPLLRPRFARPIYLQDVHAAFPELKTLVGHAGAKLWWDEAVSVVSQSIAASLELSAWFWGTESEQEQDAFAAQLVAARDRLGIDRLVFGSDHVSGSRVRGPAFPKTVVDWFRSLPERADFTEAEVAAILGGNAVRLLGL
jgi:predicted TIM-barrel fold metal-dependent hydrolase